MSSPLTPAKLERLRSLLQHLEQTGDPGMDAETLDSLKNLLRSHLRALEIAHDQVSRPPAAPPE